MTLDLLNAISYAMILFLVAAGLSLILGVMGILNLAHGAIFMIGAYVGLTLATSGNNWLLSLFATGICAGIVGLAFERAFLSRLHKKLNEQVLLTLGLVYVVDNLVRWIVGPIRMIGNPPSMISGAVNIGDLLFPSYRFLLIFVGVITFLSLWLFEAKTRTGAIIRAGMEDKEMTIGLGLNYGLISTSVFVLGATLAGFSGFLATPIVGAYLGMGLDILLLALIVVVVGGVGSVKGAFLGAIVIGLIDSLGKSYFPDLALFMIYLVMIIILMIRPQGILGTQG